MGVSTATSEDGAAARGAAALSSADALDRAILEDLVQRRRVSAADGERLMELRRTQGQRLARLLISAGVLSQEGFRDSAADLLGWEKWEAPTEWGELGEGLGAVFPGAFLRFNAVAPVSLGEGSVTVAMAWPPDESLVDAMRQASGREVRVVVGTQRDVEGAIAHVLAGVEGDGEAGERDVRSLDEGTLRDLASEAPVVQYLSEVFERAVSLGASDIHLERAERKARLRYRVDGDLVDAVAPAPALYAGVVSRIKIMARLDVGERRLPQDGRINLQVSGREVDMRVSVLPSVHGEDVVLRILDRGSVRLDLDELGLSGTQRERFRRLIRRPEGMLLLTGPTGSGKTTTLYSALKEVSSPTVKVVTVEDPVEYHLDGVNQIQARSEIGLDFARCLRSILRHDPDVIMVGEIRDRETAGMAVQSALTGHLVLSTLHTNSASAAFARLLDMGVEDYLIASAVIGVMAQRLVRKLCQECMEAYTPDVSIREKFGLSEGAKFHRARGCRACLNMGYRGRTVVAELLEVSEPVQRAVLDRASSAEVQRVAREQGMRSLWEHALEKVMCGETSYEQVVEHMQE